MEFTLAEAAPTTPDAERLRLLENPGFGRVFSDHMASASWHVDKGWYDAKVEPLAPFAFHPGTAILHYAQGVFEGLKAYRHDDGSIWCFRPEENAVRLQRSCRRIALPTVETADFLASIQTLAAIDRSWVPEGGESSLYLRPFVFATQVGLGNHPTREAEFHLIGSPSGDYFAKGVAPITVWVSQELVRAFPGGTGAAKFGGNYAAGFAAHMEAELHECDQVIFLGGPERTWIEELGGMNVAAILEGRTLVTPALTGTILEGVTRSAVLRLAADLDIEIEERPLPLGELVAGARSGELTEFFACGTAAVVNPIGRICGPELDVTVAEGGTGPVTSALRDRLVAIQYGRAEDVHGWMHRICP